MVTLAYLVAIGVVYVVLSEGMERAVRRTMRERMAHPVLRLVDDGRRPPEGGRHAPAAASCRPRPASRDRAAATQATAPPD